MNIPDIIIIDDDPDNNAISKIGLVRYLGKINITTFVEPEEGFQYIKTNYSDRELILFLDINMPTITGWEFLDRFDKLPVAQKKLITIYILSSSLDTRDIERAKSNKYVKDYVIKPLTKQIIHNLFSL